MRFLSILIRKYPGQSIIMLIAMLLAGLAEGFGLSALLPLLSTAIGSHTGAEQAVAGMSTAEHIVRESLQFLGIPPTLEVLLLVILCTIVLKSILIFIANKRVGFTVAQIATDLRLELLRALIASRWEFHLRQPVGAHANAMVSESSRAGKAFLGGAEMTIAAIQTVVFVGVACLVSWKATLAALAAGLVIFYILKRLIAKARRAGERQVKLLKSLLGQLVDSLQSIKPMKAMALEYLAESVLSKETNKLNKAFQKEVLSKEYLRAFQEPMRFIFLLTGLYVALIYMHLTAATVLVLIFLIGRVLMQTGKVQEQYQKMVVMESGYWSLRDKIKEAKEEREKPLGTQAPVLEKAIRLDRVGFAYAQKEVLRDVSLTFSAGQITAIVGPSGTGKTTIVDLLIGLLRPNKGEIFLDDLPLAQIDLRKWRQLIGYVPQESWLLHDSVFNNVTIGDPELTKEDAIAALRAAGAWGFVQKMPQGINSTVGERGGKISGGQRQRIAIARALVHKPKLLILDEATTALDPKNEKSICKTLIQLRGKLTILAISHQPAVLEVADQAYRLQNATVMPLTEICQALQLNPNEVEIDPKQQLQLISDPAKLQ